MSEPPADLWNHPDSANRHMTEEWWRNLSPDDRQTLTCLCDARWNNSNFGFFSGLPDGEEIPLVQTNSFFKAWGPSRQDVEFLNDCMVEFREYLGTDHSCWIMSMCANIHVDCSINSGSVVKGNPGTNVFLFSIGGGTDRREFHIRADWNRIRRAKWLLPPSEQ